MMHCHELFKDAKIRKSDRRAYGVNGEPVVTLGIVDLDFKINGVVFNHSFTILRGLIHPMLLGMDFLVRYRAKIDLGTKPGITLNHPSGKTAHACFIKNMPKSSPPPHVALLKAIEIPAHSFYYADAYLANIEDLKIGEEKPERLLGIWSTQKVNDFFDPGFLLRDSVVPANAKSFKVELANPSAFPLKVAEDTPLGLIFDYDCEIYNSDQAEDSIWENKPDNASDDFVRKQALLSANINMVEVDENNSQNVGPSTNGPVGCASPCERRPDHQQQAMPTQGTSNCATCPNHQSSSQSAQNQNPILPDTMSWLSGSVETNETVSGAPQCDGRHALQHPPQKVAEGISNCAKCPTTASQGNSDPNSNSQSPEPMPWLRGAVKKKDCIFTMAYSDEPEQSESTIKYSDTHGANATKDEKAFMVDMDGNQYTPEQRTQLETVLERNSAAFAKNVRDTGCTDLICHHVKIDNPRPVYLSYNKGHSAEIRKEIDDQTNGMLAEGILVESESPYCSPIVMVRKKSGGWRYCVDLRKINHMTEKASFPMPRIEDALRKLKRPKYFSSLDLLKAYFQIPVAQEDQKYYAFSDGRRHLQFTRCPMGGKNSGSTLALLMELVLRGLPPESVIGYLDDILLATEDWDSHMVLLDKLLKAIIKAKLKLCPSKCQFGRLETKCLGHTLTQEGIGPDNFNLNKVRQWTEAKSVAEVRTFLGLTGYYRSLIEKYAHISAPLTDLLHKEKTWVWGPKEKQAFHHLKQKLLSEPIAAYPDFDLEFLLKTDASKVALGAVLAQVQNKRERMIACMSKKFTEGELKWATFDRVSSNDPTHKAFLSLSQMESFQALHGP